MFKYKILPYEGLPDPLSGQVKIKSFTTIGECNKKAGRGNGRYDKDL
jgi:hypothetical protein